MHHDNGDFREEDLHDDQGHGDDNDVVDDVDGNRSEEEEQEGYDDDDGHDAADVADDDFLGQDENPYHEDDYDDDDGDSFNT